MIGIILTTSLILGISNIDSIIQESGGNSDFNGVFTQVEIPQPQPEPPTQDDKENLK